jgi:hypothetical protein
LGNLAESDIRFRSSRLDLAYKGVTVGGERKAKIQSFNLNSRGHEGDALDNLAESDIRFRSSRLDPPYKGVTVGGERKASMGRGLHAWFMGL